MHWNLVQINETPYIYKSRCEDETITTYISDFKTLKSVTMTTEEVVCSAKDFNKAVECSPDMVLDILKSSPTQLQFLNGSNFTEASLELKCKYKFRKIPFQFVWSLSTSTAHEMADNVTLMLLRSLFEAQRRETELLKLVQSKDEEIQGYKLQGFTLVNKYIETKPVNPEDYKLDPHWKFLNEESNNEVLKKLLSNMKADCAEVPTKATEGSIASKSSTSSINTTKTSPINNKRRLQKRMQMEALGFGSKKLLKYMDDSESCPEDVTAPQTYDAAEPVDSSAQAVTKPKRKLKDIL